jgi:4-amino-4-deoxy-L-arabinose transferase-like glycosyltransferase
MKRLILLAAAVVLVHLLTNGQYGFHRDELATVDDGRHLAWGYVAYPPLTPFVAHVAWMLFGSSLIGLRFFASLAQAIAVVVTGLMARELGGNRPAQLMAGLATAISPVSILAGHLFQYVTFDYLWWVLTAYFLIRLLKSEDPRWWLGIGVSVGLGAMTKYTIGVLVIAMGIGLLLTPARRLIASRWLLGGIAIAAVIFAPHAIWEVQHHLISVDFLRTIHARDVRIGRTSGFVLNQLFLPASLFTIPLWGAGLYWYFFTSEGKHYRSAGWMFLGCFAIFLIARGRDYYMAPAYPALFAAGAVWLQSRSAVPRRAMWGALAGGGALGMLLLPIAPVNSPLWNKVESKLYDFREEIGWQDLAAEVAAVRDSLPPEERAHVGIYANNYGEAGAIELYGAALGLPAVISGMNSYWLRGYPEPPPSTLIVLGSTCEGASRYVTSCEVVGKAGNRYGVMNEEAGGEILLCRGFRRPWAEVWAELRRFG